MNSPGSTQHCAVQQVTGKKNTLISLKEIQIHSHTHKKKPTNKNDCALSVAWHKIDVRIYIETAHLEIMIPFHI